MNPTSKRIAIEGNIQPAFTRTLEASSVSRQSRRGFTTTSEGENESLLSFFLSAVGAKARNSLSAFTLIELLVVIAIIGILSSVVMAAVQSSRSNTAAMQVISNMKQLQTALEMYRQDHGYYPRDDEYTTNLSARAGEGVLGFFPYSDVGTFDNKDGKGGDLNALVDEGYLPSLPQPPAVFRANNNYYIYYENLKKDQWKCGGKDVGVSTEGDKYKSEYVLYYYYLGSDYNHGNIPEGTPVISMSADSSGFGPPYTEYPHLPCISSQL